MNETDYLSNMNESSGLETSVAISFNTLTFRVHPNYLKEVNQSWGESLKSYLLEERIVDENQIFHLISLDYKYVIKLFFK